MTRKKGKLILTIIVGALVFLWIVLTFVAQRKGPERMASFGNESSSQKALIVYNPDVFYNLDEQVCTAFAEGLTEAGWYVTIATVAAAEKLSHETHELHVFCANTYNWAPDWPTSNFIENHPSLDKSKVVAITLGSGSTKRSQSLLEEIIQRKEAELLSSEVYWLMRPNEDTSTEKSNIEAALESAKALGKKTAQSILE
ncbi:hypothetical protein FK220_009715 [Flavobacteriaceae bacterium TP-CH-4]|uniref:Uncharacterized protein n=1 Tax=Pelagihabitans pacificus TaxID=2696054 RepID=A0A967ATG2_9FLAO|nr:hypothetical protein [Pelagihabitans pacificus]NHF59617.1 hypothetical protein [Pelagihabitans pacificus]